MMNRLKFKLLILSFVIAMTTLLQACQKKQETLPTASSNVTVLEQVFHIPKLNRDRQIRIYLPPNYQSSDKRFAVLYMHDGQNLFDDATAYSGEWGIDETLNKLSREDKLSLIVVGIDNGHEKRMNELSPWENSKYGAAEGKEYMEFVVNVVKPFIDKNYRTLSDQSNTAIMGSSMGGLISQYAIFEYSDVFSKAGIFSPSFWFSDSVYSDSRVEKLTDNTRLYYLMGGKEGIQSVDNMMKMVDKLKINGFSENAIFSKISPNGDHNEAFWRSEFEQAILWLFEAKDSNQ